MKAAVITFPGSNCDDDCVFALANLSGFAVDRLWHKDTPDLAPYDVVCLPGGFSYGDYLRCGAIAALSPIMERVKAYVEGGGLVLGSCNGFQMLCEAGLLPGALARNQSLRFICKDVVVRVETENSPWTQACKPGDKLSLPIAHGDGRYVIDDAGYEELKRNGQILLTYDGENPNGSAHNIAGVCSARKNVFGLMPHPERATDLRSQDGKKIWASLVAYLREKKG